MNGRMGETGNGRIINFSPVLPLSDSLSTKSSADGEALLSKRRKKVC
jgi:hypothetical protein